jgi:hypothetical protein
MLPVWCAHSDWHAAELWIEQMYTEYTTHGPTPATASSPCNCKLTVVNRPSSDPQRRLVVRVRSTACCR